MAKKSKREPILFNSRIPEYAFLSAFYPGPFVAPCGGNNILFPHREAYYQWHKTKDKTFRAKIVNSLDASRSKYFGSAKSGCPIVDKFDAKREKIMREAIRYQFVQNPVLRKLLSAIKGPIVEDAPWDEFFGTGRTGEGKNVHGKLLVEFRDEFDDEKSYQMDCKYSDLKFYPYIQPERRP